MEHIVDIILSVCRSYDNRQQKKFLAKADKDTKIRLLAQDINDMQGYILVMILTNALFIYLQLAIGADSFMLKFTIFYVLITLISLWSLIIKMQNLQKLKAKI